MRSDPLSPLVGLLALLIGLFMVLLMALPLLVANGLIEPSGALRLELPGPARLVSGGVGIALLAFMAAKLGAMSRVQGLTSGLKAQASTSLSVFMRRISLPKPQARPAPRSAILPCELCRMPGDLTGLPAPLLKDPVRVCLACAGRFPAGRLDWAALTPFELENVLDDKRLATRVEQADFLLGVAHLFEGRGLLDALLKRPLFQSAGAAGLLAHALEQVGAHEAALAFLARKAALSPEDFLLLLRLRRKDGSLAQVKDGSVPSGLLPEFAEALLEAGDLDRAKRTLAAVPRERWTRREYGLALRMAQRAGDFKAAEAVFGKAEASLPLNDSRDVHYAFAQLCERAGRLDRARRIYQSLGPYRDAPRRLETLAEVSREEAALVSDLPALPAASAGASGHSAFVSAGTLLHRRYQVLGTLGRGGMGFVFLARDMKRDRPVAVKRIASVLTAQPAFREALIKEATAAWHLEEHPAIAKLHKIVAYGSRLDLVVEYVEGEPLSELLAARGRFTPTECLVAGRTLLSALSWAHAKGVLHRDLKPANVMRTRDGGLKVLDFGVARGHGPDADAYVAPERRAGKATVRSDLYSWGVTLHELFTGRLPVEGEIPPEGTPAGLAAAVTACLKADPAGRPKDAAEAEALLSG